MIIENCPKCQWPLNESSLTADKSFFNCPSCDAYIALQTQQNSTPLREKFARVDPNSITRFRDHRGISISFKWSKNHFALIFALMWNGITWIVIGSLIAAGEIKLEFNPGYVIFLTHPTIGFVTGYWALASFFNRTYIMVSAGKISTISRPLPWFGDKKDIDASAITQLYVEYYSAYKKNNRPVYAYRVMAQTTGKADDICICRGLNKYEQAVTIEKEVEDILGIKDMPVDKEHRPS